MPEKLTDCLATWAALNAALRTMNERDAVYLLEWEKQTRRDTKVLLRIHSRLNKLRAEREREEILKG